MTKPLLRRQADLIEYMTSGAVIFDDGPRLDLALDLSGIRPELLQVEARFSYAKRMEKITAVFPKTFELLGHQQSEVIRAFVEACPPRSIGRLDNARQFQRFVSSRWMREAPDPPYLRDVAACELACAEVEADPGDLTSRRGNVRLIGRPQDIRCCPTIILRRCAYDVRPLFEDGSSEAAPARRDIRLVFARPPGGGHPQIFEVIPAVFDLLSALDDWTDPTQFGAGPDFAKLIADLTAFGLLEVRA
jgi:hypothetical protein